MAKRSMEPSSFRSTRGAISELTVSANLMARGYEVFRALSPSASCDLIALKDGEVLRVEVRTGTYYEPTGSIGVSRRGDYDLLAIVVAEIGVLFEPELPTP